jgi:hypothetical protein
MNKNFNGDKDRDEIFLLMFIFKARMLQKLGPNIFHVGESISNKSDAPYAC